MGTIDQDRAEVDQAIDGTPPADQEQNLTLTELREVIRLVALYRHRATTNRCKQMG